ncbi:MAG: sulfatase-like hydrolase/transferase [Planctomycetota bacterium]
MRTLILLLLVAMVGTGAWLVLAPGGGRFDLEAARRALRERDIVVVTLDTTRADRLGCYGHSRPTSPAIDALAAAGVRFETAYAPTPITLPSHATIFTGQDPPRHGVRNNGTYRLPGSALTLAEVMREHGRETAAFVGAFVLDSEYGLDQGFDHYDDDLSEGYQETAFTIRTRRASLTVERALDWIRSRGRDRPFFLWLHFFDPHAPYNPPPELRARFGETPAERYDAEIRAVDDAIARFRDGMLEMGRSPLWAILADHGEGLFDHEEGAHGIFIYEETVRVPFILSGEGILPPLEPAVVARQADLMPTILELCGIPIPDDLDGASLLAALEGEAATREVYLESMIPLEDYGWSPLFGMVRNRWKFIEAPRPELYHLAADPGERNDLARAERPRVTSMREALQRLRGRRGAEVERIAPDGAHLESLHAVGYLSGGGLTRDTGGLPDPKEMIDIPVKLEDARDKLTPGPRVDPERACATLREVVRRNPENGTALRLLGYEALRLARVRRAPERDAFIEHARAAFEILRERAPEAPDGELGFGLIALFEGDAAAARESFERVHEKHPEYLPALENLMQIAQREKDLAGALGHAEAILALDPEHREARFGRAHALLATGRAGEALPQLERLLPGRDPVQDSAIHYLLGECHRALGAHRKALEEYGKVEDPVRRLRGIPALEKECREALAAAGEQKGD